MRTQIHGDRTMFTEVTFDREGRDDQHHATVKIVSEWDDYDVTHDVTIVSTITDDDGTPVYDVLTVQEWEAVVAAAEDTQRQALDTLSAYHSRPYDPETDYRGSW